MHLYSPTPLPPLRPVLRRHLLLLQHGPVVLRPLQRSDLALWRRHYQRIERACNLPAHFDAEASFLCAVQRSQLQHDNDRLLLGSFDAAGELLDQVSLHLRCSHARSVELHWLHAAGCPEQRLLRPALQALGTFLFEQVGIRRLYVLLPCDAGSGLVATLQSVGFEHEGLLRDHHLDVEGWQDRQLYALTAPVWRQRQPAQN
ncbi:GNAT family N-acetyltransferase [Stenotrophomonas indicatrix]|nr:GNAT family protein [Stenotrophomonas indicatrix]MBO1748546.1 GNAT family N-acetyltransferase [Stenotrophomonas indicatrix]